MKRIHYERAGTLELDEGLALVRDRPRHAQVQGCRVLTKGLRLATFLAHPAGCSNPACGLEARYFAIERCKGETGRYHLNLYGINKQGHHILMTHDHTLARSLGGTNELSNTTMMCEPCNLQKSKRELSELKRQRVRAGLDPHTGQPLSLRPDNNERESLREARALASLTTVALARGMTVENYRQHCERQGTSWQEARPTRSGGGIGKHAKLLGLSRAGYGFYRYDHNQYHRQYHKEPALAQA